MYLIIFGRKLGSTAIPMVSRNIGIASSGSGYYCFTACA